MLGSSADGNSLLQSFSAGVGNWVADEILYQARIHPEQKAASLTDEQTAALHHQMQVPAAPSCLHTSRIESHSLCIIRGANCECLALHRHGAEQPFSAQAVLKTAVEAGADSSKYPDSWMFHQKVTHL